MAKKMNPKSKVKKKANSYWREEAEMRLPLFAAHHFHIFTALTQLANMLQNMEAWFRHSLSFFLLEFVGNGGGLEVFGKKKSLTNSWIRGIIIIVRKRGGGIMAGWAINKIYGDVDKSSTKSTFFRVAHVEYNGRQYVDVREHFPKANGGAQHTKTGIAIPVADAAKLIEVLQAAVNDLG